MGSIEFKEIIDSLEIDDIRHLELEWKSGEYRKKIEYHQIKVSKEEN